VRVPLIDQADRFNFYALIKVGMNILIACHSKYAHYPVKIHPEDAVDQVDYIDTGHGEGNSQYNDWSKLQSNFYDMVWGINCPVYTPFAPLADQDFGLTLEILGAVWRTLKVGGTFVMPLHKILIARSSLDAIESKAQTFIVDPSKGGWSVESKRIVELPVQVEGKYEYALIFTKRMKGGRRRRARKTRRRRRH
jgi:hypothetical protein